MGWQLNLTRVPRHRVLVLSVFAATTLLARVGWSQAPDARPVFRSATAAVTVDVVVRDKSGRPVLDLSQGDFEVFEDGSPQRLISVEQRSRGSEGGLTLVEPGREEPSSVTPLVEGGSSAQSIVAVVFHQLSRQAVVAATAAARSMVGSLANDEYVGIFAVNLNMTVVSPFTRDRAALLRALDKVLRTPPVQPGPSNMTLGVAETTGPTGRYVTPESQISAEIRQRMALDTESSYRSGVQAASFNDLIAHLARFPGRKSVILFSEGLDVSPRLETVVARALTENVTVYTVHAGGLGTGGRIALPDRSIDGRELTSNNRRGRESWRYGFLTMDPTSGLGPLAAYTGGFLVSDTNDLTAGLKSINADRYAYYVLAYSSSNVALDGTTRQIEVRVKRPGVSVRARTAYLAARPDAHPGSPLAEERALLALAREPRPREFEFAVRAFRTPRPGRLSLVSVVVEVPASGLSFSENPTQKRYAGELSIFTRVRRESDVVATENQLYQLTGDLPQLPSFKQRPLSYFRMVTVPPGSYRLDVVVQDTLADRVSTAEVNLISEPGDDVMVGDLFLVHEVKRVGAKQSREHPFGGGRTIITPSVSGVIGRAGRDRLQLAVPVVSRARLEGRLVLGSGKGPLTEISVVFEALEKDGSPIRLVDLPIGQLSPSTYEVTLTATTNPKPVVRRTMFVLLP